ncbi:hypothetical protein [Bacillus sp. 1P06AnD]|uniref:hypothetical protein n=1 Tax=Bacillus sp. 1P06AnD TaxID=3132208 RepID=UPI0039A26B3B
MRKRYNPYNKPPWLLNVRAVCCQFIVPICIFQAVRTFFFPTVFDIFLLLVLVAAAFSLKFNIF